MVRHQAILSTLPGSIPCDGGWGVCVSVLFFFRGGGGVGGIGGGKDCYPPTLYKKKKLGNVQNSDKVGSLINIMEPNQKLI